MLQILEETDVRYQMIEEIDDRASILGCDQICKTGYLYIFRSHSCQHQHLDESKVGKHSNDQQPLMYRQVGVKDDLICSSEVAGSIVIECSEAPQHGYKLTEVSQL
jgi:hypothetical protein